MTNIGEARTFTTTVVDRAITALRSARVSLTNEKRTQLEIGEVFTASGIAFMREVRLAPTDVPDFMLAGGVAVEVKLKNAIKTDVFKQLQRYARHPDVQAIILVANVAMGLPEAIEGKPAYYVSLGGAWL